MSQTAESSGISINGHKVGRGETILNGVQHAGEPRIISPHTGDEFLLFPDLPLQDQSIPLRIRASPGEGALEVRLDDRFLFLLERPFAGRVPAQSGDHLLSLHRPDELKPIAQVRFRVREEHHLY